LDRNNNATYFIYCVQTLSPEGSVVICCTLVLNASSCFIHGKTSILQSSVMKKMMEYDT